MSVQSATSSESQTDLTRSCILPGSIAGVIGGIVFGMLMTMQMPMIMEMAIPGMYGFGPSLAIGWILHLFHSAILGAVFGVLITLTNIGQLLDSNLKLGVAGLLYGIILWVILASFVMPAWVGAMTEMSPTVPDWNIQSLMGHAVYGVILGIAYAVLAR